MDYTELFYKLGAIQKGHFIRSSGRHTDIYVQCARLFENPSTGAMVAKGLAENFVGEPIDIVMSAAIGGMLIGYEVARALDKPFIYCERQDGAMVIKRGFKIPENANVLLIEDEITTGTSVREMMEILRALGARCVAVACIIDKSNEKLNFGVPKFSLAKVEVQNWRSSDCPICKE